MFCKKTEDRDVQLSFWNPSCNKCDQLTTEFVKTIAATLLEGYDFIFEVLLHGFLQLRPNATESRQFGCQISAVITQYFPSAHCSRFICNAGSRETDCLLMVTISFFFFFVTCIFYKYWYCGEKLRRWITYNSNSRYSNSFLLPLKVLDMRQTKVQLYSFATQSLLT